jgi:hypothetical protein
LLIDVEDYSVGPTRVKKDTNLWIMDCLFRHRLLAFAGYIDERGAEEQSGAGRFVGTVAASVEIGLRRSPAI